MTEIERLTEQLAAAEARAEALQAERDDMRNAIGPLVKERKTATAKADAAERALREALDISIEAVEELHRRHRPSFSVTVRQCAGALCRRLTKAALASPPVASTKT